MFKHLPGFVWVRVFSVGCMTAMSAACSDPVVPECSAGELVVDGTHVDSLYNYDATCEFDCWSFANYDESAVCAAGCPLIDRTKVNGILVGDRRLMLFVPDGDNTGAGRVFSFGYVDESGGAAPDGWGFLAQGPLSYIGDHYSDGVNARFDIQLIDLQSKQVAFSDGTIETHLARSGPYNGKPGRLEILSVSEARDRITGRFFVGVDSPTAQPGGEMLGCFDLEVGPVAGTAPATYQLLGNP